VQVGLSAVVEHVVRDHDTAIALGSGDVPVLGTPRVVALAEAATVAAVAGALPDGATTVGTRVELDHLRPTPVGATVRARATLSAVESRRLVFAVAVTQDDLEVATGTVTRVVVDRTGFVERL
jgi:fluoroacetyl-CoA thioesterase